MFKFNRNKMMMDEGMSGGLRQMSDGSKFQNFINWFLAALVFVTPLLFLPFTSEAREFNKLTFIFLSVVVILAVWVIKILTTRSVSWVKTSLDYILLAFTLVYLLASFMSLDQPSSFLGYYGRFTGSFLSVFSLVVLYYIVVNNVRTARVTNKLMNALLLSGGIATVYGLLQIFKIYVLPFSFAKTASFNTVGSMVSLAVFSAIMVLLSQWSWLTQNPTKLKQAGLALITVVGLVNIFLINSFIAWLVLALTMIVFLAMAMVMSPRNTTGWVWKPLLVLVISILFVGFNFLPRSVNPRGWVGSSLKLPVEIQLSNSATWEMTKNALKEKPLLGFGPGTTGIAFGQIKPETLNKSIVWSLNFDRASSEIANIAIETGLLGLLAFEATSILFLIYALFFLMRNTNHSGRMHAFGILMVFLALYITHFFYFFNSTMYFLYWLSIAIFMAVTHWQDEQTQSRAMSFSDSPRSALSWMFASLLVLAVLLVGGFFQIAVYFADTAYASGLKELQKDKPDLAVSNTYFNRAIERNQYRDTYYLALGQNLVFQAAQEARKEKPDVQKFQGWISQLIAAGNSATQLSPERASNWSARSQFYSQIRALSIPGTDDLIIGSAEEAVKRDDRNPILQIQLAQAYANASETIDPKVVGAGTDTDADGLSDQNETDLKSNPKSSDSNSNGISDGDEVKAGFNPAGTGRLTSAQLQKFTKIDQDKLRKAEEALRKSIEIKNDLPDAYVALGRVYERWGKLDDAEKIMSEATKKFARNADVKYEYGRILFNLKKYVDAEGIFNDVIKLVPNHANTHYSLGLIALQKNDRPKALAEFEKTLEIVGTNTELENAIKQLKEAPATTPAATPAQ